LVDIDPCAGTLLYCDHGQTIEEVIQYLLGLHSGLRGDSVAYLRVGGQNTTVVSDLRKAAESAYSCGSGKRTQDVVVHIRSQTSSSNRVETDIFIQVKREPIGAYCAIENYEKLALLLTPHTLDVADETRALWE
jgi:hypothetical protein